MGGSMGAPFNGTQTRLNHAFCDIVLIGDLGNALSRDNGR